MFLTALLVWFLVFPASAQTVQQGGSTAAALTVSYICIQ